MRQGALLGVLGAAFVAALAGCDRDVVGPHVPVAVSLESLPFPAVVAGDVLRDSTGAVAPVRARAFNYLGEELPDIGFRYLILDRGASIDSVSGVVTGDSVRDTPVRVVAFLGQLQTQTQQLAVVQAPDSLAVVTGADTLEYSLTDTTQNVSAAMGVRLLTANGTPVRGWIVSFSITHASAGGLARLVEGSRTSHIDTTATDGLASRQLRVDVQQLGTPVDSIVLAASARYRGEHVRGSPARLVVHLQPRAP